MVDFITSDTHFNHRNICGPEGFVSGRQIFSSVEEMNETIIENFNKVVKAGDHTYHLGDLSLNMKKEELDVLLKRLNGSFSFVMGNHDSSRLFSYLEKQNIELPNGKMKYTFTDVGYRIKCDKKLFFLTHFPMVLGAKRELYRNLCGHIHDFAAEEPNSLNVGVDSPEIPERPFGEPLLFFEACDLVNQKWASWKEEQG